MAKDQIMSGWECGICLEAIDNQPHMRIAADMAVEKDLGGISSLMQDEIMIFAAFHMECIIDTESDEDLENVIPYLKEVRILKKNQELGSSVEVTDPAKANRPTHLRIIEGGDR